MCLIAFSLWLHAAQFNLIRKSGTNRPNKNVHEPTEPSIELDGHKLTRGPTRVGLSYFNSQNTSPNTQSEPMFIIIDFGCSENLVDLIYFLCFSGGKKNALNLSTYSKCC